MFKWIEDGLFGAWVNAYRRFRSAMQTGELDAPDEPAALTVESEPAKAKAKRKR